MSYTVYEKERKFQICFRFKDSEISSGGIRLGLGNPNTHISRSYNRVINDYLVNLVTWKFAAESSRDIAVVDGSTKVFSKASSGSPSFEMDVWLESVKEAAQVQISINMNLDYVKTQYRLFNKG